MRVHDAQALCLRTETSFWELASFARFARLARFARFDRGNGVINRRTEPPYHTRRGPGWRELNKLPQTKIGAEKKQSALLKVLYLRTATNNELCLRTAQNIVFEKSS